MYALGCVIAIPLCSCINPVNFEALLKDPKITIIIENNTLGLLIVNFENLDLKPRLSNGAELPEGEFVGNSEVITITNANIYTRIEYYYGAAKLTAFATGDSGEIFTVDTSEPPFNGEAGPYMVTVVGFTKSDEKPYGTFFYIMVE
jgi:hypothetical protein